jgi:sugar lactone lactonase YvrE
VAGNGARAYGGDGTDATDAYLGNPNSVAVDSKGRVVIADTRHSHVRRVDEYGIIHNLAGSAFPWDKGDGGPSIYANLIYPQSVEVNQQDHIYIADGGVGKIRMIDATTGVISTVVGTGIKGYTGDGSLATDARVGSPTSIRFDVRGNLYFSDSTYNVVRTVNAETGIITTVVGNGEYGFSPDGTPALEAPLKSPRGLEISSEGTIYVSDTGNNRVRMVDSKGMLRTVAGSNDGGDFGDGGPATQAKLNSPYGLRLYNNNVLLICDMWNNRLRAVKLA